jgi:predicted chitinase
MSYINKLNAQQKNYALYVIQDLIKNNVTNPITIASILAVISKESGFTPRNETTYKNTSVERIRKVFKSRVANLTDNEINKLKKSDEKFFEWVYGKQFENILKLGQEKTGDGFLYRGRGFNGLTGRGNYRKYGKLINVDIENQPELVNNIDVGSKILIAYMKGRAKFWKLDINNIGNAQKTLDAIYLFNSGGNINKPIYDTTGGYNMAKTRYNDFYKFVNENLNKTPNKDYLINTNEEQPEKKNNLFNAFSTFMIAVLGYFLYKKVFIKKVA